MIQSDPKTNTRLASPSARPTLGQTARNILAGGLCAFGVLVPVEGQADWQVTEQSDANGTTTTYRRIKPLNFAISELPDGPAPANDCPGLAFEIANPKPGEARCVGYVARRR